MTKETEIMNYLNEPIYYKLSTKTKDFSRVLETLKEGLDIIDRNQQQLDITENKSIKKIYEHNRDEAIEQVYMTMEWLRKNMPGWHEKMMKHLFSTDKPESKKKPSAHKEDESSINIYW